MTGTGPPPPRPPLPPPADAPPDPGSAAFWDEQAVISTNSRPAARIRFFCLGIKAHVEKATAARTITTPALCAFTRGRGVWPPRAHALDGSRARQPAKNQPCTITREGAAGW